MNTESKLFDQWNLWFHSEKDNWKLSGYKKIYEINNETKILAHSNTRRITSCLC